MLVSFLVALTNLGTQITGDPALQAFAQAKWGKDITARLSFRNRTEISMQELPLVLITCPHRGKRLQAPGGIEGRHKVRIYFGFYQPDPDKIVAEQLGAEELLEDAIFSDTGLTDTVDGIAITESSNDEGKHHPSCFTVMDLDIDFTRSQTDESTFDDFLRTHTEWDLAPKDGEIEATDDVDIPQT